MSGVKYICGQRPNEAASSRSSDVWNIYSDKYERRWLDCGSQVKRFSFPGIFSDICAFTETVLLNNDTVGNKLYKIEYNGTNIQNEHISLFHSSPSATVMVILIVSFFVVFI